MSDFSDRPFVAGSLTGLRAFDVDKYGRLVGPTFREVFKPGENVATCAGHGGSFLHVPAGASFHAVNVPIPSGTRVPQPVKWRADVSKHQVGAKDCSCGYYAYFDGENDYARSNRVSAIIEGHGVCTVGDRGFRAEKAQLLGLIDDRPLWKWLGSPLLMLIFGVFNAVRFGFIVSDKGDLAQLATLTAAVVCFGAAALPLSTGTPLYPKGRRLLDKVRKNYPDVPVYRTQRAALRAHPITVPEGVIPTPDEDDFWTRPVSL